MDNNKEMFTNEKVTKICQDLENVWPNNLQKEYEQYTSRMKKIYNTISGFFSFSGNASISYIIMKRIMNKQKLFPICLLPIGLYGLSTYFMNKNVNSYKFDYLNIVPYNFKDEYNLGKGNVLKSYFKNDAGIVTFHDKVKIYNYNKLVFLGNVKYGAHGEVIITNP